MADSTSAPTQEPTQPPLPSGGQTAEEAVNQPRSRASGADLASRYGLLGAFLLTILIFSLAVPDSFPTGRQRESILTLAAPSLIIAVGLTVVLVMQDFDLSFGAHDRPRRRRCHELHGQERHGAGAVAIIADRPGARPSPAASSNGFMVAYLGGSSFIITLAMGTVLTGVEFGLTSQDTVYSGLPDGVLEHRPRRVPRPQQPDLDRRGDRARDVGAARAHRDRALHVRDRRQPRGGPALRRAGPQPARARLRHRRASTAAVVGLLLTSQSASYAPNRGTSYLLPAFAAVFLGAAVFRPGEFNVPGTVVGVLFLGVIQTGLTMLDLETYVINLVQGGDPHRRRADQPSRAAAAA